MHNNTTKSSIQEIQTHLISLIIPDNSILNSQNLETKLALYSQDIEQNLKTQHKNITQDFVQSLINKQIFHTVRTANYHRIKRIMLKQYTNFVKTLTFEEFFSPVQTCLFRLTDTLKNSTVPRQLKDTRQARRLEYETNYFADLDVKLDSMFYSKEDGSVKLDLKHLTSFIHLKTYDFSTFFQQDINQQVSAHCFSGVLGNKITEFGDNYYKAKLESDYQSHVFIINRLFEKLIEKTNLTTLPETNLKEELFDVLRCHFKHKNIRFIDFYQIAMLKKTDKFLKLATRNFEENYKVYFEGKQLQSVNIQEFYDTIVAVKGYLKGELLNEINPIFNESILNYFVFSEIMKFNELRLEKFVEGKTKRWFLEAKFEMEAMEFNIDGMCQAYFKNNHFEYMFLNSLQINERSIIFMELFCVLILWKEFTNFGLENLDWVKFMINNLFKNISIFENDTSLSKFMGTVWFYVENNVVEGLKSFVIETVKTLKEERNSVEQKVDYNPLVCFEVFVLFFDFSSLFEPDSPIEELSHHLKCYSSARSIFFPQLLAQLMPKTGFFNANLIRTMFERQVFRIIELKIAKSTTSKMINDQKLLSNELQKSQYHGFCALKKSVVKFDLERIANNPNSSSLDFVLTISGFLSQDSDKSESWKALATHFQEYEVVSLNWESSSKAEIKKQAKNQFFDFLSEVKNDPAPVSLKGIFQLGFSKVVGLGSDNPFLIACEKAMQTSEIFATFISEKQSHDFRIWNIVSYSLGTVVSFNTMLHLIKMKSNICVDNLLLLGGCLDKSAFLENIDKLIGKNNAFIRRKIYVFHSRNDDVLKVAFKAAKYEEYAIGYDGITKEEIVQQLKCKSSQFIDDDILSLRAYVENKYECVDCTSFIDGHSGYSSYHDLLLFWKDIGLETQFKIN